MIFRDVTATVGRTPMVELGRLAKSLSGRVVAKLELRNPCGSVKDRVGVALIDNAERKGVLRPGMTLVEATGGNTGIGLAFVAAIRGYRLILTMPETMSTERVALLRHLGAEVVLTPGILMGDAVARATQLVKEIPGSVMLDQFRNPANPEVHRRTTAVEIWDDTQGAVDVFVSAVGTGGTITGVGEVLKERKPTVRIVAVEPANAAVLSGGPVGNHLIPGIGVGFIPEVLNRSILDEVIAVTDGEALTCARRLAREEGIMAGVSSGAALHAALAVASRKDAAGRMIVVLLPDTAERYVTTTLFARERDGKRPVPLGLGLRVSGLEARRKAHADADACMPRHARVANHESESISSLRRSCPSVTARLSALKGLGSMEQGKKWSDERLDRVRRLIRELYVVVGELNEEFASDGRKFTPDGHLVGSIGEVIAAYAFGLQLLQTSAEVHDAKSEDGKLVQIKLTGGNSDIGLYSEPEHLIVLQLADKRFKLVYNGPGATAWEKCGKRQKNGQRRISLSILEELNTEASAKIQQIREFP